MPMPKTTLRTVAVASLCALAALAAIITADIGASVSAQSDEQTGRIIARRLDDGRTEFGWQPADGERVLPRQRYFPAGAAVGRWLRSSPVEVEGTEIGRINARLRDGGRIEFAFTPTDGERILPPSRYFPADARVSRWLRSTEITISLPRDPFTAVSAGRHICGLRASGAVECWIRSAGRWQIDAPAGRFTAVSGGGGHTCGLRETGSIVCWGYNEHGQTDTLNGSFSAVSAGHEHTCGLRTSGAIECWGHNDSGQADTPSGSFSAVSAGAHHTCGLRTSGAIECWGHNDYGQTDAPGGSFSAVSAGAHHTCGLRASGAIECWGDNGEGRADAPGGSFSAVSAGWSHTCGLRKTGAAECWGHDLLGETNVPSSRFEVISAGSHYSCGLWEAGKIACWGGINFSRTDDLSGASVRSEANQPPRCDDVGGIGPLKPGDQININDHCEDPEGHWLEYAAASSDDSVATAVTDVTDVRVLTITATLGSSGGTATITLTASDLGGLTAQTSFRVMVRAPGS